MIELAAGEMYRPCHLEPPTKPNCIIELAAKLFNRVIALIRK